MVNKPNGHDTRSEQGRREAVPKTVVQVAVAVLLCTVAVLLILPALGRPSRGRPCPIVVQTREVGLALAVYAGDHSDALPPAGADWELLLIDGGYIEPEHLVAPEAEQGQRSFIYAPHPTQTFDGERVLVYTNPELDLECVTGGVFVFHDLHSEAFDDRMYRAIMNSPDFAEHRVRWEFVNELYNGLD